VKILFVTKTLSATGGGAERVLAAISAELARRGHEVIVATFDPAGAGTFYPFSSRIRLVNLAIGDSSKTTTFPEFVRRIGALRALAAKIRPDVAIGFMHSSFVPLALGLRGSGVPVVGSEHSPYEHYHKRPVDRMGLAIAAPLLARITAISERMRSSFPRRLRDRMVVIDNPMMEPERVADPVGGNSKVVLCVGRLGPEKDHSTLISAFSRIADEFPNWRLRVAGEGALRSRLEEQVERLSLRGRVELPGAIARIGPEYSAAQLFVLPSIYESFGLATAEAMSHGLPVIAFADCSGASGLIEDGANGLLVPTGGDRIARLADRMAELMGSPAERQRLGKAASRIEFPTLDPIATRWEQLLHSVASGKPAAGRQTGPDVDQTQRK